MKKIMLFVLLLTMGVSSGVLAQGLGLRAGMNLSTLQGDEESLDMKPGYHVGLFYQYPVSEKVIVEPALLFTTRGAKEEFSDTYEVSPTTTMTEKYKIAVTTQYLEVPLTLQYFIDPELYISVAPTVAFLLSNKIEVTSIECINESCTGTREEEDYDDEFQKVDLGFGFGLGYNITDHISISTNYQFGLFSIIEEEDVFNRVLSFSLGYRF